MEFHAVENTDLIWKTLLHSGKFKGYTKDQSQIAQNLFTESVTNYDTMVDNSLLQQNKDFITMYVERLSSSGPDRDLYKQEDIRNKRISDLDTLYLDKSAEYDAFTSEKPKPIDFSDTNTDSAPEANLEPIIYSVPEVTLPPGTPLESLLREILANQDRILALVRKTTDPD